MKWRNSKEREMLGKQAALHADSKSPVVSSSNEDNPADLESGDVESDDDDIQTKVGRNCISRVEEADESQSDKL